MLRTKFFIVHSKWHHNIHALKNVETLEGQATLLGKTNSGIQIAKLIQWFCLNFQQQNNRIGCRGNLLPESQFYCQYFAARLSFISRMQTSPPRSPRENLANNLFFLSSSGFMRHEDKGIALQNQYNCFYSLAAKLMNRQKILGSPDRTWMWPSYSPLDRFPFDDVT